MAIFGISEEVNLSISNKEEYSDLPLYKSEYADKDVIVSLPGSKWTVDYFHRAVKEGENSATYDINLDPTLQNFTKVDNLVLYVDEVITPQELSGSAYIDLDIIPNPNDVFVSRDIDGRLLMFTITSVTKENVRNSNITKIRFAALDSIESIDNEKYKHINDSVIETLYYNKDYRIERDKPLYTKEEFVTRKDFRFKLKELVKHWNQTHIDSESQYYLHYTRLGEKITDPQLESFVKEVIGINNIHEDAELLDIPDDYKSIFDLIVSSRLNKKRLYKYFKYNKLDVYNTDPYFSPLAFTSIDKAIVVTNSPPEDGIVPVEVLEDALFPSLSDNTYIFRDTIYKRLIDDLNDGLTLTVFEELFLSMMNGEQMDNNKMNIIYEGLYSLDNASSFYFIPIYIYMLKYYLTTFTVKYLRR